MFCVTKRTRSMSRKSVLYTCIHLILKKIIFQINLKNFQNYFVYYRKTSFINGREYVPFMSVDMKEKFAYPVPYR